MDVKSMMENGDKNLVGVIGCVLALASYFLPFYGLDLPDRMRLTDTTVALGDTGLGSWMIPAFVVLAAVFWGTTESMKRKVFISTLLALYVVHGVAMYSRADDMLATFTFLSGRADLVSMGSGLYVMIVALGVLVYGTYFYKPKSGSEMAASPSTTESE